MLPISQIQTVKSYINKEKINGTNIRIKNKSLVPYALPYLIKEQTWTSYFSDMLFYSDDYSPRDFLEFNFEQISLLNDFIELDEIRESIYSIIRTSSSEILDEDLSHLNSVIFKEEKIVDFFLRFTDAVKSFLIENSEIFNTAYNEYINRNKKKGINELEMHDDMMPYIDQINLNSHLELKNQHILHLRIMHVKVILKLLNQLNAKNDVDFPALAHTLAFLDSIRLISWFDIWSTHEFFFEKIINKCSSINEVSRFFENYAILRDYSIVEPQYFNQAQLLSACSSLGGLRGGFCNGISIAFLMKICDLEKNLTHSDLCKKNEIRLFTVLGFKKILQTLKANIIEKPFKTNNLCTKLIDISYFLQRETSSYFSINSDEIKLRKHINKFDDFISEVTSTCTVKCLLIKYKRHSAWHSVSVVPIYIKDVKNIVLKTYFYFDTNIGVLFAPCKEDLITFIKMTMDELANYKEKKELTNEFWYSYIDMNSNNTEILRTLKTEDGWNYSNLLDGIISEKIYESKPKKTTVSDEDWNQLFGTLSISTPIAQLPMDV